MFQFSYKDKIAFYFFLFFTNLQIYFQRSLKSALKYEDKGIINFSKNHTVKIFEIRTIFQRAKQLKIWRGKIGEIWWFLEYLQVKLLKFLQAFVEPLIVQHFYCEKRYSLE